MNTQVSSKYIESYQDRLEKLTDLREAYLIVHHYFVDLTYRKNSNPDAIYTLFRICMHLNREYDKVRG